MAKELFIYALKDKFIQLLENNEVDSTQVGIIPDTSEIWVNGEYLPLVYLSTHFQIELTRISYEYEELSTGFQNYVSTWSVLVDANGEEIIDVNGNIVYVADQNAIWDRYDTASTAYKNVLQTNVDTIGVPQIDESFMSIQTEYYDSKKELYNTISAGQKTLITTNANNIAEIKSYTPEILQNGNEVAIKVGNNTSNYTTINYSKFSNDLTGRIEATPEEFTFRPSAGNKSIRDESALIKKIKGNTIVWNQIVKNGNFVSDTDWTPYQSYYASVNWDNGLTVTSNYSGGGTDQVSVRQKMDVRVILGHKYLTHMEFSSSNSSLFPCLECFPVLHNDVSRIDYVRDGNHYYFINNTRPNATAQSSYYCYLKPNGTKSVGDTWTFKKVELFDLTQMFGAGNEPTTVEEFKALFPNGYYDYNDGELVSMTSNGLFANGFNQFNGEYAEVLPNNTYYLGGTYTTIGFTDEVGGTLEDIVLAEDKLYTPTKKGYIYATGTNININLSHTGVRNGEYEPYWDATKDLSIIQKYFPNGMRSAGSICDEISFDEATQKWVAIQRVDERVFTEGDEENDQVITDGTNTHYELAEPILTTIEEPVDLSYKVGDFGVEKMLSDSLSAPFKADIIYQFNATDRVRENSMNIAKLSKKHNLLESEVDALESKALTTEEQNFSSDQKAQVATNLGGNTDNGLVRYVDNTIPVESFVVKDSSGISHKYVFPIASDDEKTSATGGVLVTKSELDAIINEIYNLWYGIEWDVTVSTTQCTRIGNSYLHKSLPIQNKMRGCILNDNGEVVQYLDDWLSATRDGSIGQVMVEIPAHYRKFETDGNIRRVKISENALPDFHLVPKVYISAYEATVQRSTTKLCSVVNTTTDYRGGGNNSSWDGTYRTLLGRPATVINLTNFRNYARKRNTNTTEWNCNDYNAYKTLFWLYYVEYANKNCQLAFNSEKDSNGYAQGGLGNGVTTLSSSQWSGYNSYYPFVPCGYTDSLGNNSGVLSYDLTQEDGTVLTTVSVNRYRGVELPFGHILKWTDGVSVKISPTVENGGTGESEVYVANDTENYNSTTYDGYEVVGLEARSNGYVKELIFGENGDIMPMSVGAGSTTYWADNHYTNIPTSETLRGVVFGGHANNGMAAGFASAYSYYAPSATGTAIGSRLCFIPRARLQE